MIVPALVILLPSAEVEPSEFKTCTASQAHHTNCGRSSHSVNAYNATPAVTFQPPTWSP